MNERYFKKKLDSYVGKPTELHITKKDKEWLNCFIISEENEVYKIKERKFGIIHLFLGEILSIKECWENKT